MTRMAILLGALLGAGVWLIVTGLRPGPPSLGVVLGRLNDTSQLDHADPADRPTTVGRWLAERLAVPGGLPIPHRDLALLGMSVERFLTEKCAAGGAGLMLPPVLSGVLMMVGVPLPWTIPVGGALAFATALFFLPDLTVRSNASRRRSDFRHALSAYFDWVRLAFGGGAGPSEALEAAALRSQGWAFTLIAESVQAAQHARIPPWQGLARLGQRIGVQELTDLADLADLAGSEGAKVAASITAYSQQMRTRRQAELISQAGAATTTMTAPIAVMGLAFIALISFPQIYQLLTG